MKNLFKKIIIWKLTLIARLAIYRFKPKIIAVTGNVGKTSTKDAIYSVVKTAYNARKSEKSLNSDIGLPLAILGLESAWNSPIGWSKNVWEGLMVIMGSDFPEMLVLEVGADHPGDIEQIGRWLHPDIVVLTKMSETPVHIEFFSDVSAVLREKMFLAKALKKNSGKGSGILIVNADDAQFMSATNEIMANSGFNKRILFGRDASADVQIVKSEIIYDLSPLTMPIGQQLVLRIDPTYMKKIDLPGVVGSHLMYSVAGAYAVAVALGIEQNITDKFADELPKGRMRLILGQEKSVIIDDTYNSSPLACSEALKTLESISIRGRKIAVLADMKELGEYSDEAHKNIGRQAGEIVHTLITVGEQARLFAVGAKIVGLSADRVFSYKDSVEAGEAVEKMIRPGDVILVKGSQSMRMEKTVAQIMDKDLIKGDFLVRQEKAWQDR